MIEVLYVFISLQLKSALKLAQLGLEPRVLVLGRLQLGQPELELVYLLAVLLLGWGVVWGV